METHRERVMKAIDHLQPERIPLRIMGPAKRGEWFEHFGVVDYFGLCDRLQLDFRDVRPIYTGQNTALGLTIWGIEYGHVSYEGSGYSALRGRVPLADATSVSDVENFLWPNPDEFESSTAAEVLKGIPDQARMVRVQYAVEQEGLTRQEVLRGKQPPQEGVVGGEWLPLICTLFNLFGLEDVLIKLHTEPKIIECAVARIEEFLLELSRRLLEEIRGLADILWYGDDFATQNGLMLSPEHWRRFLKPTYKKLFDLAKSYGLEVWFHSCGTFRPVLPDLIDMGIDVWETVQVHLPGNDPKVLKREYGQDIAFYGAINTQSTLPFGTPEDVRKEVRERIRILGAGGGYICGSDHSIMPDVPYENVLAMIDEAKSFRF